MLVALIAHRNAKAAPETEDHVEALHIRQALIKSLRPRWIRQMEAAAEDGAEHSLRASIREEGWRAFAEGGIPAMRGPLAKPATMMASSKPL
jgi:hypothetical protein